MSGYSPKGLVAIRPYLLLTASDERNDTRMRRNLMSRFLKLSALSVVGQRPDLRGIPLTARQGHRWEQVEPNCCRYAAKAVGKHQKKR